MIERILDAFMQKAIVVICFKKETRPSSLMYA